MLTEVAFCLTCYFGVLTVEYIPLLLENRQVDKVPFFHNLSHNMHEIMAVFAATGAFLSFFHQGSLGGVAGVLFGRPFGFREHILVWPWTFFLFTWSAAACGPCFTILVTKITEKATGKKLVKDNVIDLLAKIAGWMLLTYIIAKIIDTLYWANVTAPAMGFTFMDFYTSNNGSVYGLWIFILEIVHLRRTAGDHSGQRESAPQPEATVDGRGPGLCRRLPQSLGDGTAGSGRPCFDFRKLGHLSAQLAGDRHHHLAGGLRGDPGFAFLSLPADFSPGARTQPHRRTGNS